jgi:hypothetical protein
MMKLLRYLVAVSAILFVMPAQALYSPLEVALFPEIQFPSQDYSIAGLRLSLLMGKQQDIYGLDLGVVGNITTANFVGTAVSGITNMTSGPTIIVGLQASGIANVNDGDTTVYGLQVSAINYNSATAEVIGFEVGLANEGSATNIDGFEIGLYNRANEVYGFQIGLVNIAKNLHGMQIGFLNFNVSGFFFVSPGINVGF